MLEVLLATSRALSSNDAEMLEQLAVEAGTEAGKHNCLTRDNRAALESASVVLGAQVEAAAAHIALRSRVLAAADEYGVTTWHR